jgi:tRNA pseudouridine55 synthase
LINGFVIIDKPAGITSHDVVSRVRRILGTRKVGHTGTLDPFATGVLPVAVNDGTKAIPFLDEGIKCYEAVMRLGIATDTLDMTGTILRESDSSLVTLQQLESVLKDFTGNIQQIPPMYSALKRDGQPLYKLARQGLEVERQPRDVEISALELLSFEGDLAALRVTCSRGTYIRTLADDIGRTIGCGATLQELRRTASGAFKLSSAVTLEGLEGAARQGNLESHVISPRDALQHLSELQLTDPDLVHISHGRALFPDDKVLALWLTNHHQPLLRLVHSGRLVAIGELVTSDNLPARIKLKRVFM